MNTPHERLTRTTFSLPLGEVHALVGGAVNARPLLFLHGFPDHPPTAVPFLEHLAETQRVVASWLRGYDPVEGRHLVSLTLYGEYDEFFGQFWGKFSPFPVIS